MNRWMIRMKPAFRRRCRDIGHVVRARMDKVIADIANSGNPTIFGRYKSNKVFSCEIGRADGLIYLRAMIVVK